MKKLRLIFKFDRRLAGELRKQRRPIMKGLLCVILTALLTTTTIPLIKWSLQAINDAGDIGEQGLVDKSQVSRLASELKIPEIDVLRALGRVEAKRVTHVDPAEVDALARELKMPVIKVQAALTVLDLERPPRRTPYEALQTLGDR